ncbi:type II secretion system protein GspG [Escherichia coli]|nr:type II secretion system protein GspG [Escherichia coli]
MLVGARQRRGLGFFGKAAQQPFAQRGGALAVAALVARLGPGLGQQPAQGLKVLAERPADASASNWRSYLERLPNDPWGKPYQYLNPGVNGEIDVFSLGADGQPGGEGINADIGSWQL